jgi:SAM-dependent methyltransferase
MTTEVEQPSTPAPHSVMWELVTAYRLSQVVYVVAKHSFAEHLAAGRTTAEAIARAESIHVGATARILRAAASIGIVTTTDGKEFSSTPLLDTLLKDKAGSLRGLALALAQPGHWLTWGRLAQAMTTGEPQAVPALGVSLWEYYETNSAEAEDLNDAMAGMTAAIDEEASQIIKTYPGELVADIGGGLGHLLHDLMRTNPELQGVVFDVPAVAESARVATAGLDFAHRLHTVGGDFFESVPEADTYLLRYILHDWDDESAVQILKNCRQALRPGGRLFVLEMVIEEFGGTPLPILQDVNMLVLFGGRERTLSEFGSLLEKAGLRLVRATPTSTPLQVIEAELA